jgi:hypothetical protein
MGKEKIMKSKAKKVTKAAAKKAAKKAATKPTATNKVVMVHRNSAGKWVYPQGNAAITLLPQPEGLGSNQLVHYTALKAAFANKRTMALPALITALGKAKLGRRTLRRAGRAQGFSFIVK